MAVVPRLVVVYDTARMTYVMSDLEPFKPERLVSSSVRRFRDAEVDGCVLSTRTQALLDWIVPFVATHTRRVFISTPSNSSNNSSSRAFGESTEPPQLLLRFAHSYSVTKMKFTTACLCLAATSAVVVVHAFVPSCTTTTTIVTTRNSRDNNNNNNNVGYVRHSLCVVVVCDAALVKKADVCGVVWLPQQLLLLLLDISSKI
jgi:hypothetical protein